MTVKASKKGQIALTAASIVITPLFGVIASPFIRVLRMNLGFALFWAIGIALTYFVSLFTSPTVSILTASLWITIGSTTEAELRGLRIAYASMVGLISGLVVSGYGIFAVFWSRGITTLSGAETFVTAQLPEIDKVLKMNGITAKQALLHLPSSLVILLALGVSLSFLLESRVKMLFSLESIRSSFRGVEFFKYFKVPDLFIWPALISMCLMVIDSVPASLAVVASNLVNIGIALYFIQGLAVTEAIFNKYKISNLMRVLIYILVITQAFVFFSVLGFADFWLDIRQRLKKPNMKVTTQHKGG